MDGERDHGVRVSVVVPIYNPGRYLDACLDSLLGQSMDPRAYEIVLVDDGSTDGTGERLDRLADQEDRIRVIHQPNSGWPGRPRNVGIREARGEYVQFVDQDDELGVEALERMYALATRAGADIVLGKVAGTMAAPSDVFARTVEDADLLEHKVIESLSPHKFFRREFLLDKAVEFPEGKVRLEDQLFMVRAYLRAGTIAILGDYPCYYWMRRDDGGNSSSRVTRPKEYFGHLEEVVQAIESETSPGPFRDAILARTLRVEVLIRVREPRVQRYRPAYRDEGYAEVRAMVARHFRPPNRSAELLTPCMRLRFHLVEEDRLDSLVEFANRAEQPVGFAEVERRRVVGGTLRLRLRTGLVHANGQPLVVVRSGGRYLLDPVLCKGIGGLPAGGWVVDDPLEHAHAELRLSDRKGLVHWFPETRWRPTLVPVGRTSNGDPTFQVVVVGDTVIDPRTVAGGRPLAPGAYDLQVGVQALGLGRSAWPRAASGRVVLRVGRNGTVDRDRMRKRLLGRIVENPRVRSRARTMLADLSPETERKIRRLVARIR